MYEKLVNSTSNMNKRKLNLFRKRFKVSCFGGGTAPLGVAPAFRGCDSRCMDGMDAWMACMDGLDGGCIRMARSLPPHSFSMTIVLQFSCSLT